MDGDRRRDFPVAASHSFTLLPLHCSNASLTNF